MSNIPEVGNVVMINPEWIDAFVGDGDPPRWVEEVLSKRLLVTGILSRDDGTYTIYMESGNKYSIKRDGTFWMGSMPQQFFLIISDPSSLIKCLICGGMGTVGFNLFHCSNKKCQNG